MPLQDTLPGFNDATVPEPPNYTPQSKERWESVAGYEGVYTISDRGHVRSLQHTRYTAGRLMRLHILNNGYRTVALSRAGKRREYLVHRLVATAFCGSGFDGAVVNHINGVKHDNRAINLEWCTISENAQHARRLGLNYTDVQRNATYPPRYGINNDNSRLTDGSVLEIRELAAHGWSYLALSERFHVTITNIRFIVQRKTWRHLL